MARKVMAEQVVTDLEFLEMIQQFQWTTTSQLVSYIGFVTTQPPFGVFFKFY
ncbi:hypothetical protein [Bacillus sp. FSL K6-2944]|uniref:hypothetical protein n=1 Tax=Bacillus sp. FSL K6-2944 TaxID=2921486 RepID=UPI0030F66062